VKILYDNLLASATLSATNGNESYPIANVIDRFLEKKFQTITTSSVITVTFATDQAVSAIALGFHNLTSASYVLKNSGGSTLISGSLEITYDTNITYFTETACRSIEITIGGTASELYVGGISAGTPFYVVSHNVNPRFDFLNQDNYSVTRGGQATGRKTTTRKKWRATLSTITTAQINKFETMIETVGGWFPVYADLYEGIHTRFEPIHAILSGNNRFVRDSYNFDYSTTVVCEEVR